VRGEEAVVSPTCLPGGFSGKVLLVVWVFSLGSSNFLDKVWNGAFPE